MSQARPAVLIVDDVEANLVALEAQLARLDCDLVRASSGNEALRQLLKREFAVMLLDVQMPHMDGFEVARLARDDEATREVPIVFVTAMHETEESMLRGYGAGAIDVLFKPVNPDVLRSKVSVFLALHHGRMRLAAEVEAHKDTLGELEAFNYSVSHDLRAPLRAIEGFGQVLQDKYADVLDARGLDLLTRTRSAAQRMTSLIEDLLRLSRSGRTEVSLRPVALVPMVEAIVGELRAMNPERAVELVLPRAVDVMADQGLLRIMLENLVRNAWKFTGKCEHARIELGVGDEHGQPTYYVRDNGAGFDPTYADQLFQPFRRLHSRADFEGNGIGLAIVQRIIRRHGGRVWAESRPGDGATFYFTLGGRA